MFKKITLILLIAVVYFIAGTLGLKLAYVNASATAVWPPTGIAIAALLIFGRNLWPGIYLGAFFVNLATAGTVLTSVGIALGNTLEAVVAAYMINRFAEGTSAFESSKNVFRFVLYAGTLSTMISATLGVSTLTWAGFSDTSNYWPVWSTWWLGDAAGAIILAPAIILWSRKSNLSWNFNKVNEFIFIFFLLIITAYVVFIKNFPTPFLLLPPIIWLAYRFGPREASLGIILLSGISIWTTLSRFGPFSLPDQNQSLLLLQSFMSTISLTGLILAGAIVERNKNEKARTDFFWMAAHQLRTPLNNMSWTTEYLLRNSQQLPQEIKSKLMKNKQNVERMVRQINEMLNILHLRQPSTKDEKQEIAVVQEVRKIINLLQTEINEKEITVFFKPVVATIPVLKIRAHQFHEIIQNVLSNAIKYNKKGGSIEISIESDKESVILKIKDTGLGIPKKDQAKIFTRFFRATNVADSEGSGLALSVVKSYIDELRGKIWFTSNEGEGTTFYIEIPYNKS